MVSVSGSESAAEVLRNARIRAGLTPAELARRAGVPPTVVNAYESGRREIPLPALRNLVAAAGAPLEEPPRREEFAQPLSGPIGKKLRRRRDQVRRVLAEHGVTDPRVFGSVARSSETPDDDLDLLVTVPPDMSDQELAKLRSAVEEILGVPVKLVSVASLPSAVRAAVEAAQVEL